MSALAVENFTPLAQKMSFSEDSLSVDLTDGRSISVPLSWFPRLLSGTVSERNNWRFIGQGEGFHWEDLDEDISVESLIVGRPSRESQKSLQKWLKQRQEQDSVKIR